MDGTANESVATATATRWTAIVAGVLVMAMVAAVAAVAVSRAGSGPPVIRIAGGLANDGALMATAETDAAAPGHAELTIWAPVTYRFELTDGARIDAGEAAAWRLSQPRDLAAAAGALADRFDLGPAQPAEYDPSSYIAGATDGSGPSLWVGPTGDWSYSDPQMWVLWDCAEPAVPPDAPVGDGDDLPTPEDRLVGECEPPTPPAGVPSANEARSLAQQLFADLDMPGEVAISDVHADEWGARVHATISLDGRPTDLWVSASWGGDAQLTSVSATLTDVTRVDGYPTIDAEQAVERLERGGYGWGGGMLRPLPMPAVTDDPAVQAPAMDTGSLTVAEPELQDADISSDGAAPDVTDPDEPVSDEVVDRDELPSPMPVEPVEPVEPEVVTIRLVDVERVLVLQVDADATVWLLPGYRFIDSDGGTWQVLAVADEYLDLPDEPEPEPMPEPMPEPLPEPGEVEPGAPGAGGGSDPEPGGAEPGVEPSEPGGGEVVAEPTQPDPAIAEEAAQAVVGASEADATERIESIGLVVRVVSRDGEHFIVTDDWRTDRINLEVEDGIVTAASVG